jgi:hypothetical protein
MTKKNILKSLKSWHGKLTLDDQADLLLAMFGAEKKALEDKILSLERELTVRGDELHHGQRGQD